MGWHLTGKLTSTAGYALAIAGLLQLEISGLFQPIPNEYFDEEKLPFGPPSSWTRGRIHDGSFRYLLWDRLFRNKRTGFQMIVVGTLLQAIGTWL
jgi:hypothetical protein